MIKGVKSIAEYAIRKYLEKEGFIMKYFSLAMNGCEGTLTDECGNSFTFVYDNDQKDVYMAEN